MNTPRYVRTAFELAICLLFVSCGPVPVPNGPTSDLVATEAPPSATPTNTVAPTATNTSAPLPTDTPLPPPPLKEIFSQVGDGVKFLFPNDKPNLIDGQYVEAGDCIRSGPFGLRLVYNFSAGGGGGWGVHWDVPPLNHFNASQFTTLTFWVKGTVGGETFQIGMKDTGQIGVEGDEREVKVDSDRYVQVSASDWRQVDVPLNNFADNRGTVLNASINNISFTFEQRHGSGTICIDDIAFILTP